jgi:uncharacterized protein with gpF-like domain
MFVPKKLARRYSELLQRLIFDKWREATQKIIIDKLSVIARRAQTERPRADSTRTDAWPDDAMAQLDALRAEYDVIEKQSHDIARGVFVETNTLSHRQWYEAAKRVMGVDLLKFEPWIETEAKTFVQMNVGLITKTKEQVLGDVNRIVMEGLRQGKRWETMSDEILGTDLTPIEYKTKEGLSVFGKLETRADLIARDQTSKLWGDINQKRQENVGVEIYIWRTADDERVRGEPGGKYAGSRPSHAVMNGKYCTWKDATVYADTLEDAMAGKWKSRQNMGAQGPGPMEHPSVEINCRCYGEAVFSTLFAEM